MLQYKNVRGGEIVPLPSILRLYEYAKSAKSIPEPTASDLSQNIEIHDSSSRLDILPG